MTTLLEDARAISEAILGRHQMGAAAGHKLNAAAVRRLIQVAKKEVFALCGYRGSPKSPLDAAIQAGSLGLVREMLARGADPKECRCRCWRRQGSDLCRGQCHLRAAVAHPRIFVELLNRGVEVQGGVYAEEISRPKVSLSGFVLRSDREGSALEAMIESSGFDGQVWVCGDLEEYPVPLAMYAVSIGRELPCLAASKRWKGIRAAWVSAVLRAPRRPAPVQAP